MIAAIGISGPAERFRKHNIKEHAALLVAAAMDISQEMGGSPFDVLEQLGRGAR